MRYTSAKKHPTYKKTIICHTSFNLVFSLAMTLYFHKYFLIIKDSPACFAVDHQDTPTLEGANVTMMFKNWFMWGLVLHCVYAINSAVGIVSATVSTHFQDNSLVFMIYGLVIFAGCFWVVKGCFIRWSHAGFVCSGDLLHDQSSTYLIETGAFMKAYLTTFVILMGIVVCVGCLGCCSFAVTMYRLNDEFGIKFLMP